jgi:uroporphyrin-III C-methyltransferase
MNLQEKKGMVYLIGAGPGDPDLITVKGLKILKEADLILYDSLINPQLLELPEIKNKEKIFVGKRKGQHSFSQEEINELLLRYARAGKIIVRLKGGDPFIFGRGGEELSYLKKHKIAIKVIPGITTASASSAVLQIPLTHRELGRSVIFITGYSSFNSEDETGFPDYNWKLLSDPTLTIVIYMGLYHLERIAQRLIEEGRNESTPVVIISKATLPEQKFIRGTLKNIYQKSIEEKAEYPSLIIIGEVINLMDKDPFS